MELQQHLLVDADDTLWENNIYFERAIEAFVEFLDHSSLKPEEVRVVLNDIERMMGYGSINFVRSLQETYRQLAERPVRDEDLARLSRFGEEIMRHPIEVMDGVRGTLAYLAPRHCLILLTKGHEEEQKIKIESSGLERYFEHTIIVEEKNVDTYARLIMELRLEPSTAWMIGNSPRSDINPARAAGLNAVYIPHVHTWMLEKEEIEDVGIGKLLTVRTFAELCEHF